ncbi:hypothetical protein CFOL_v3_34535 [Cephalotus follicularis]|uniref:HLH domain-containing protein n=1 Tax=Cephalotus follicularis TaxID=3775 RepID=A0A1Q3DF24_CEPFO|nr:hypothetical protein CFOL_v3_34535 [Cephalotus follicularis]
MGVSPNPLVVSLDFNGMIQENEERSNQSSGSLWSKVLQAQAKTKMQGSKQSVNKKCGGHMRSKRGARILRKNRKLLEGSRGAINRIQRKVRTLKKLVPMGKPIGLDGLFRETADYILSLQMRVEVMQIMVNVLAGSDE